MKTILTCLLLAAALLGLPGCENIQVSIVKGDGFRAHIGGREKKPCTELQPFYAPRQTRTVKITNPKPNPPLVAWFGKSQPMRSFILPPNQFRTWNFSPDELPITFSTKFARQGRLQTFSQDLYPNSFGDDGFISFTLPVFQK